MTKENRFEGLMGAVGKNKTAQTSKHSDVQKSEQKKKPSSSDISTSQHSNISTSNQPNIQTSVNQNHLLDSNLDISTSKHTDISTSKKAKSANPDYTRTTVYLPKKMHKQLKAIALDEEREMSSIVEELIETWMNKRS